MIKTCTKCQEEKDLSEFDHRSKGSKWLRSWCKLCSYSYLMEYRHKYKLEALYTLGNQCDICNEKELEFLTIDHVDGGGCREYREMGNNKIKKLLSDGQLNSEKYAVLCRNCNSSRHLNPFREQNIPGLQKTCIKCNESKHTSLFSKGRNSCLKCRRISRHIIKVKTFSLFGSRCSCCGENDVQKLNMDHINDDGNNHRKSQHGGTDLYSKILKEQLNINQFQLLCWNCNYSKYTGGTCIHQRKNEVG